MAESVDRLRRNLDLARLSSMTRAVSFLAVGAVLLLGGFLYQHLGTNRAKEMAGSGI